VSNNRERNLAAIWEGLVTRRPFWDPERDEASSSVLPFVISDDAPEITPEKEPEVQTQTKSRARTKKTARASRNRSPSSAKAKAEEGPPGGG
jgi:hypothetical protein